MICVIDRFDDEFNELAAFTELDELKEWLDTNLDADVAAVAYKAIANGEKHFWKGMWRGKLINVYIE